MDAHAFDAFTSEVGDRLARDEIVLGLLALGSTAQAETRDRWSDHDFIIVTTVGAEKSYLDAPAFLPHAEQIIASARHSTVYRSVLYRDGHKVDYAVVDLDRLAQSTIARYRILFDRGGVAAKAQAAVEWTRAERAREESITPENFAILAWSAHCRASRGETLSSRQFLELAIDVFLALRLERERDASVQDDSLDPRRRLERTRMALAQRILDILRGDPVAAAMQLVKLALAEIGRTSTAAWASVVAVERMIVTHMNGLD